MPRANKWGRLEGEDVVFNPKPKRKARKQPSCVLEEETYSLDEYRQYQATIKASRKEAPKPVSSREDIYEYNKAQLKCTGGKLGRAPPDFAFFSEAARKKDLEAFKWIVEAYFTSYKMYSWPNEEVIPFINAVMDTYDLKVYDIVFYSPFRHSHVDERLFAMYRAANTKEELIRFYPIFSFFLDIGGSCIGTQGYEAQMVEKNDMHLLEIMMGHEVTFNRLLRGYRSNMFTSLAKMGDAAIPFMERVLKEVPTAIESNDVQHNTPQYSYTALMIAAENGYVEMVKMLIKRGAYCHYEFGYPRKTVVSLATNSYIKSLVPEAKKQKTKLGTGLVSNNALKRIMRDWAEVVQDPPSNSVRAIPDEQNMFQWHVVITPPTHKRKHPLHGVNFHFIMTFPANYPESPPSIVGKQYLPHPNYSNGRICLNMLRDVTSNFVKYSGWSSGYSALSIMMQLQSFLFDKEVEQNYGAAVTQKYDSDQIQKVYTSCAQFSCETCGFNSEWKGLELPISYIEKGSHLENNDEFKDKLIKINQLPFMGPPDFLKFDENYSGKAPQKSSRKFVSNASLVTMPDDTLLKILDYLVRIEDLAPALRICKYINRVGNKYHVWTRRELVCFYSKASFLEDVLGVGLVVERHSSGNLKTLSSPMDLISRNAFFHQSIRRSTWQEPFDYWLPVVINEKHCLKSLPYLKATIVSILLGVSFDVATSTTSLRRQDIAAIDPTKYEEKLRSLEARFQPLMVLDVLPKLMNHTIVSMMRADSDIGKNFLHHSEKALQGYCSYHHMLLEMCRRFPEIQKKIDSVLEQFVRHESARVKLAQPDLGELLVYLSVASKVTWRHIGQIFVQELLDRSVVWMLDDATGKGHAELAYLEDDEVSEYRLNTSFNSSITGIRLLMFQVFFLEKVGRPTSKTPREVLQRLNESYGQPQPGIPTLLQKECEKIYAVKLWPDYFNKIGVPLPSKSQMTTILRQAILNSERKGYHVNRLTLTQLYTMRKMIDRKFAVDHPDPRCHPDTNSTPASKDPNPSNSNKEEDSSANMNSNANISSTTPTPTSAPVSVPSSKADPLPAPAVPHGAAPASQPSQIIKPVKIYVGNLSYRVTALDLEYVFQQFGKLVSSEVVYDENEKPRGFGYIEVENEDVATTLLEFMQGSDVDRRPIRLKKVTARRERGFDEHPIRRTEKASRRENGNKATEERAPTRPPAKISYNGKQQPVTKPIPTPIPKPPTKGNKQTTQKQISKQYPASANPFSNLNEE